MSTSEQVNEQCRQLLSSLVTCVKGTLVQQAYDRNEQERELRLISSDQRLSLIRDTLNGLLSDVSSNRNSLTPIFKLMDDVLIEIWSYNSIDDRLSASQVCRKWRRVSLSAKKLWTELDFDKASTWKLYMFLKRAGNSPLHITHISTGRQRVMNMHNSMIEAPLHKDMGPCGHGCAHGMVDHPIPGLGPTAYTLPIFPPKRAFPTHHFNEVAQNSKLIHAIVRNSDMAYVNHTTLALPMPRLKCLILSADPSYPVSMFGGIPHNNIQGQWGNLTKWFGGVTPQLREMYLTQINAPWEDRIYTNLTHLQLNTPPNKVKPRQLLQILSRCPTMEHLDLVKCMSGVDAMHSFNPWIVGDGGINNAGADDDETVDQLPLVILNKLWYLHFDETDPKAFSTVLPRIVCPALDSLTICAPNMECLASFTQAVMRPCDPDGADTNRIQPAEILKSFFSRTTQLKFSLCSSHQFTSVGRFANASIHNNARWIRRSSSIEKCLAPGWSFSCNVGNHSLFVHHQPPYRYVDNQMKPRDLLDEAESLGVKYYRVEIVDIEGQIDFDESFYNDIFSRCRHLKALKLYPKYGHDMEPPRRRRKTPMPYSYMTPRTSIDILNKVIKDNLCPELHRLHLKGDFTRLTRELTQWLRSRAKKHLRLKSVVVNALEEYYVSYNSRVNTPKELPERARFQMELALDSGDSSTNPEERGLVWEVPKRIEIDALPEIQVDKEANPEEKDYLDWLGGPDLSPPFSPWDLSVPDFY